MDSINLRSIDLNLLTVFEAVYEEQSQVKAAERLGMTQPAISHALGRLRHLVGDRLFQGRAKGLIPTSQADDFYLRVHQALELVREEFAGRKHFDPATSQRTFVLAVCHAGGAIRGIGLAKEMRSKAPGVRLIIRSIDPGDEIPKLLREHRLDLAYVASRFEDPSLEQPLVRHTDLSVIVRRNHPRIHSASSEEEILREQFAHVFESSVRCDDAVLNAYLEKIAQRAIVEVPNAMILPLIVETSDLLAVTTGELARMMATRFDLDTFPLHSGSQGVPSYLVWHTGMTSDPAHRWLRETFDHVLRADSFDRINKVG